MQAKIGFAGLSILLAACATDQEAMSQSMVVQTSANEDIHVFRTHRTATAPGPTEACAAAPFPARLEDYYELHSVRTDPQRGLVTDPLAGHVGGFGACIGPIQQDGSFQMDTVWDLPQGAAHGLVTCRILAVDDPAAQSALLACEGRMDGLPAPYTGGFMTSNTLTPRGEALDVPGYTTTSIVALRLWRAGPQ